MHCHLTYGGQDGSVPGCAKHADILVRGAMLSEHRQIGVVLYGFLNWPCIQHRYIFSCF